jgi:uncharacterized beta-barrel protein YwiB (DUF1934 family)
VKEADIVIHSVIENADGTGEVERSETRAAGSIILTEHGARLAWREVSEGGETESELTVSGDTVSVVRRGAIESSFTFEEGKDSESLYKIGPYAFDARVKARRVRVAVSDGGISVTVVYDMELGGAERLVKMKIRADVREEDADA